MEFSIQSHAGALAQFDDKTAEVLKRLYDPGYVLTIEDKYEIRFLLEHYRANVGILCRDILREDENPKTWKFWKR